MSLSNDISRCAGRATFDPGASICPNRAMCKRYRALIEDRQINSRTQRYSVAMDMRDPDGVCRARIAA